MKVLKFSLIFFTLSVFFNLMQSLSLIYKLEHQKRIETQKVLMLELELQELKEKVGQLRECGPGTEYFLRKHFGMKRKDEMFLFQ